MTISNLKPEERDRYDLDFQLFLKKVTSVARLSPREHYLYPILNGVPYKDLNTALDMAVMARTKRKAND